MSEIKHEAPLPLPFEEVEDVPMTASARSQMTRPIYERFEEKYIKTSSCWEWVAHKDRDGYGIFTVFGQNRKAHRVSWELYVGEIPEGLWVLHRCDNPGCVNPFHLFVGTVIDNNRDCIRKGRAVDNSGENNGQAKLTEAQVKTIKAMQREGIRGVDIAKQFGVTQAAISDIVCFRTWVNVEAQSEWWPEDDLDAWTK